METVALVVLAFAAAGVLCTASFYTGARVAQAAGRGERVTPPAAGSPLEAYRERMGRRAAEMEQERLDTILGNIERYDGTGSRQEDVPERGK